jgi:DNA repair exonuclease SbcCD ATPase subunit
MTELITRTPMMIATEINSIKEQTKKMLLVNSIEIGRRLVEAKTIVPHGEWGKWLEESVDYSKSTANNLMKIFDQYGADQFSLFGSEAKSQALGSLSYTQAVALLGVPAEERENFIKENDIENMSTRELQQAIKEKQDLEKKLKASEEQANKEKSAREKLAKEFDKLESQKKKWDSAVDRLKSELEAAKSSGNDDEIKRLQDNLEIANDELSDSRERIKKLELQLKEKPIEVSAVVEKVPEAIEKELADLRQRVGQQPDKSVVKFTVCFENLVKNFGDLLNSLSEIQDNNGQEKYKRATLGLISKMTEKLN